MGNGGGWLDDDSRFGRLVDISLKFTVPLLCACFGFVSKSLIDHETRLTVIESNRFTPKDASVLEQTLRKELPPQWFLERVDAMGVDLKNIQKDVNELKTWIK